ncbi:hypothetical protein CBM2623_B30124 [Cupriavidus taiwanensis]|nr:hypothetical protein CBM2623_B30124 [Cupriavidus taiwanensis]
MGRVAAEKPRGPHLLPAFHATLSRKPTKVGVFGETPSPIYRKVATWRFRPRNSATLRSLYVHSQQVRRVGAEIAPQNPSHPAGRGTRPKRGRQSAWGRRAPRFLRRPPAKGFRKDP